MLLSSLFFVIISGSAEAGEFLLDFVRPNAADFVGAEGSCGPGTYCDGNDGTAFSQQIVDIQGVGYWRNVVGDPATGFALEYYTRSGPNTSSLGSSPDSGGHENSLHDGLYGGDICKNVPAFSSGLSCGNATDPLNINKPYTWSGTGTADPAKMVLRMVISGNGMDMEVYKPLITRKPLITQSINDGVTRQEFVADMRSVSYTDKHTPIEVINNLMINDPDMTPDAATFDMSEVEFSNVSAGRFTFTPGGGWNTSSNWTASDSAFDEGTYSYHGGNGFDPLTADWAAFFDYAQNVGSCSSTRHSPCPGAP